jgi:SAM-dependent methyltransferase
VAPLTPNSDPAPTGTHRAYDGDAAALPQAFAEAFDVVISIATFEHIADLSKALREMHRVLKPSGVLLAQVGPLWSGWRGHDLFPGHLDRDHRKSDDLLQRLIPWQHLLMEPDDLYRWVASLHGAEFAGRFVPWVYDSPRLNRLFYDEYRELFDRVPFRTADIVMNGAPVPAGWGTYTSALFLCARAPEFPRRPLSR